MKNENIQNMEQSVLKDLGKFEVEPKFAYLWDRCVYEMHYNVPKYVDELCAAFAEYNITKESQILDTCAGSGFPALDMYAIGYKNITCVDASEDQIELFNAKAEAKGLDVRSEKCLWEDLPAHFDPEQFKALICKSSIWYAGGGWNKDVEITKESTLKALRDTLSAFYSLLAKGGVLYLDKFKDSEVDHKDTVGVFEVDGKKKELIFWTNRDKEAGIRRAKMIIKDVETGVEDGLPNVTYDLKEEELEEMLHEVGFSVVKPEMSEEKFFTPWLAIKNT
ncbi:class I SAM-dependent methyltransferase [Candidatus Parcubacteria bacterium]|nr:class I SAM-dependent methyltransferase [Candidatus Parcubacteria bacterium]